MKIRAFFFLSAIASFLTACDDDGYWAGVIVSPGTGVCGGFSSALIIEDAFAQQSSEFLPGETIRFNLRVTNNSDSFSTLTYGGCGNTHLVVFNRRSQVVFDSLPPGIACTTIALPVEFAPRETQDFRLEWDQMSSSGAVPGLSGVFTGNVRDLSVECRSDLDRVAEFRILP